MSQASRDSVARLAAGLEGKTGPRYWRSLEELADTPEFRAFVADEFPSGASEWHDPVSRRNFLQLMAASCALAGLAGCTRQPEEQIVPYAIAPEQVIPGKPLFYATAVRHSGYGYGVLAESHTGRPTKLEGNELHPSSQGSSTSFMQAAVLDLYDPDRSQALFRNRRIGTWPEFLGEVRTATRELEKTRGAELRLLTGPVTSPTLAGQIQDLLTKFPDAAWYSYDPAHSRARADGANTVFGRPVHTVHRFDQADVVLALGGDFLSEDPASLRYARDFAERRSAFAGGGTMNRLYAVESTLSLAGAAADHRLPLQAAKIGQLVWALAGELGVHSETKPDLGPAVARWVAALAKDLGGHKGRSIVWAGDDQPAEVHALVHAINSALGNLGKTVLHTEPALAASKGGLAELAAEMQKGKVGVLVVFGVNPAYDAPADLEFAKAMAKVRFRIHLGRERDETAALSHWHVPGTVDLESWSDVRGHDGTVTILQPLIAPLYGGKSEHEIVAALLGNDAPRAHDIVRGYWKSKTETEDFDRWWRRALHDGIVAGSALPTVEVRPRPDFVPQAPTAATGGLEVTFRPHPTVWDGRYANNAWLQELPVPLTKVTWDNPVLVSPATARRLDLDTGDVVELELAGRKVLAHVWIQPGQADDSITVHLGYGRTRTGRVGRGRGFNASAIRTSDAMWIAAGASVKKTSRRVKLATTQHHQVMEHRDLVREATLAEFREQPEFAHERPNEQSLYPAVAKGDYGWGMAIDLTRCIGCNACMTACQAENNIPVVGREQVLVGRAMHWIRVDRYFEGTPEAPRVLFQPIPCMQCENAPCETVCPVGATSHSDEGLNDMVYNRCVGTRYCSNNCPYKVRRFNFLDYRDPDERIQLMRNPNVTVRARGVMEKCTYCVQRISAARIAAKKDDRRIRDGDVVTACQSACPTRAIVFGDAQDKTTRVAKAKSDPRDYVLLPELNTRPRTSYAAGITNPNPELA